MLIVRNRQIGIYQALTVSLKPGAALEETSRIVFGSGDEHSLVAVWENGNWLDLQPAVIQAVENAGDLSGAAEMVSVLSRPIGQ